MSKRRRHIHLRVRVDYSRKPEGEQVYRCGFRRPSGEIPNYTDDATMCQRCDDINMADQLRMEREAERLAEAGLLEEDTGPNRQWNQY